MLDDRSLPKNRIVEANTMHLASPSARSGPGDLPRTYLIGHQPCSRLGQTRLS